MKVLLLVLAFGYTMASSLAAEFRPTSTVVTVATPSTAVRLFPTAQLAGNAVIQADSANSGIIFLGGATVDQALRNGIILAAGSSASFEDLFPNTGSNYYDLAEFWVDATNGGDSVVVTFMEGF